MRSFSEGSKLSIRLASNKYSSSLENITNNVEARSEASRFIGSTKLLQAKERVTIADIDAAVRT